MKKYLLIFAFIFMVADCFAVVVSGVVKGSCGPLTGAQVVPEGVTGATTSQTAVTDLDGKFSIRNFPDGKKVKISYVGYKTQVVDPKENINVTLEEEIQEIDAAECVVCDPNAQKHAAKQELIDGECYPTECEDGYELQGKGKAAVCVEEESAEDDGEGESTAPATGENNEPQGDGEEGDASGEDGQDGDSADEADDVDGADDSSEPKLTKEQSQAKVDELKANAQAMKDKEQSTENKLLGAAGIGATGIGGMQMASAMAEQNADQEAENAMKAYLETFYCNYGNSMRVKGGTKNIEIPGGNELVGLYSEYVNLANDLKVRKVALDMRPGIESESILDSATSVLYDDVSLGKTSGVYTSLARALMDPDGADAAAWAEQKDATAKKKKTGMIVAGVGAVGSLVGNLAINSGKDKQDKSDEILAKYEKQKESKDGVNDETIIGCIDEIVKIAESKYDTNTKKYNVKISCANPAHELTQEQALGISKNWNYDDIKLYTNTDNVVQEHEKDACETLKKLNTYIKDNNLCSDDS